MILIVRKKKKSKKRGELKVRVGLGGVEEKVISNGASEGSVVGGEDGGALKNVSDAWRKDKGLEVMRVLAQVGRKEGPYRHT
jgi:hypothetical protein